MTYLKTISTLAAAGAIFFSSFTGFKEQSFKVDPKASVVKWFASKVTGKHDGQVKLASGNLNFDGKKITGGTFDIDMTSITVSDIADKEMNGKLVGHLKSDDFFGVENHKTARFEISKVDLVKGNEYNISGKMTIKGHTEEISFPATVVSSPKGVTANAKITLDRTLWNIRYGSGKFFENIGDKAIHDDFRIELSLVAKP